MPAYPKMITYCSMTGQGLEYDQQAWDETRKFYEIDQMLWVKIVNKISEETEKGFDMTKVPLAAGHKVHKMLE